MQSILSAILAIASLATASPLAQTQESPCVSASFSGWNWTVGNFTYHALYLFTTPAHQNSWGFVDFTLLNPVLPDVLAVCSAQSNQLDDFFYGNMAYDCYYPDIGNPGPAPATFNFTKPGGELHISQKWVCDDAQETIFAKGNATVTLDCTDTSYQNTNWTLGQIYSNRQIDCQTVTLPVAPSEFSAVA